jgi:hypothetical protein
LFLIDSATLFSTALGLQGLADFLGVHVNTARRAVTSQVYNGYVISTAMLSVPEVQAIILSAQSAVNRRIAKPVYVYNSDQTLLLHCYASVTAFMTASGLGGSGIAQLAASTSNLWRGTYFISYNLIPTADNTLSTVGVFVPVPKTGAQSIPIYGRPVDGGPDIVWTSTRDCVRHLTGNRNTNTQTLTLRIKYNEPYLGYYVSHEPFQS